MPAPAPASFSPRRRWSIRVSVLLSVLAATAVVVMLNYLAARHYARFPWSWSAQTELSPLTQRVLGSMTNEVKVVVFFDKREPLYESVWNLLKEYQFANPKVRLEIVDYYNDPTQAQLYKSKYQLPFSKDQGFQNLVIFDCPAHAPRLVYASELSDYDLRAVLAGQGREVRRTHFRGEMLFTSALVAALNPRPVKAYFLQGHGESNPTSDNDQVGYSKFAAVLRENSVTVGLLPNLAVQEIPADCHLLIIAGPVDAFAPQELEKLDRYLKQGGRLLVLFHPASWDKPLGLEALLGRWGLTIGNNMVLDEENSDKAHDMVVNHIAPHPIMKPLYPSSLLCLSMPRSVDKAPRNLNPEALQVDILATTGPKGHILRDNRNGRPTPTADDLIGAVPLMAAVEKGSLRGVPAERGATRLVVVGDSLFLNNQGIDTFANRDFAYHALNWLLARHELLAALGPRPIHEYKLVVTQAQMNALYWILLLGLPGSVLLVGGLVWLRRQKW
jgi:hypothetical protein